MTLGDALALLGLAVAVLLYEAQRARDNRRDLRAAVDLLSAVREGIFPWGELYFGQGYDEKSALARASLDSDTVMKASYSQVFRVPTEPLAALVASPAAGGPIRKETIQAATVALWQIGVFNQLVGQQTDFNARHLVEIRDLSLPDLRRAALARAANSLSMMLHANGIGDAAWYAAMMRALETNRDELEHRLRRAWWSRPSLALVVGFALLTVALVVRTLRPLVA